MKFIAFLFAISAIYYFAFGPTTTIDPNFGSIDPKQSEIKAVQTATKWSWNTAAIWVLVVVATGGIARTLFQSKTRAGVTKEMYRLAKEERVTGYDHGIDTAGTFHSIQTKDSMGNDKYYTIIDIDELNKNS